MARPAWARVGRFLPVLAIAAGFALFFLAGLDRYLSFEALSQHHRDLEAWVAQNALAAGLAFFAVYVATVTFSLPGGALLTMTGGFLFGTWLGGSIVVLAATLGATLIYLAARTAFADLLRARAGSTIARMEAGFRDNAVSYLLVLRLVPIFPFFLVNLVPAFLGVGAPTYILTTFVGIIPGTFVFASVGNGLGAILASGAAPDYRILYDPEILLPLLALAALSCLPILYKRFKGRRATPAAHDG